MLDFEYLEQLVAFKEKGTLTAVANDFHISQPTITRNMKALEDFFNVELFDRYSNKMKLNENGKYAAKESAILIEMVNSVKENVYRNSTQKGTIFIGSCTPLHKTKLLRNISEQFPTRILNMEYAKPEKLTNLLINRKLDIALVNCPIETEYITSRKYAEDKLSFSLPISHPLSSAKSLSLSDMDGDTFILLNDIFWIDLIKSKMPKARFIEHHGVLDLVSIIEATALPTITTSHMLDLYFDGKIANHVNIPITDPESNLEYYVAHRKENSKLYNKLLSR